MTRDWSCGWRSAPLSRAHSWGIFLKKHTPCSECAEIDKVGEGNHPLTAWMDVELLRVCSLIVNNEQHMFQPQPPL